MLQITVPAQPGEELYVEQTNEFIVTKGLSKEQTLQMEHSLVSLSKWESKWHIPFLGRDEKTFEQTIDYIRCMTLNKNVDPTVYKFLTKENIAAINEYIGDPMTATTFREERVNGPNRETPTSELIYYWMIALNIPFECQKWHLNRLLTLIRVCNIKNQPPKKMSQREIMSRNAALNAARRKQLNTKG